MQKPNEKIVHDLIVKAKKGDHDAYTQLVNHTIEYVKWLVRMKIKNDNEKEDVTIDIYIILHRNLHKFNEAQEFLPWLHTIIDRHCKNVKRQYSSMSKHDTIMDLAEMSDLIPDNKTDMQLGLEIKETREQLSQLLDSMKEKYRDILTRYYYEDQRLKAIGEAYGISESAASRRLKTAEKHLKKLLLAEEKRGNKIYSVVFSSVLLRLFEQQTEGMPPISPEESARIIEAVSQGIQVEAMVTAATASTATGATSTGGASAAGATAATTSTTATAAASGTAASTTTAAAGGLGAKFMALGLAQQIAAGTIAVVVTATTIGVPTYNYIESEKAVQAALVLQQEQEEQERQEEQARIADEAERVRLEEEARAAEEEAARIEAERLEAERVAAEQEQARQEAEESAATEQTAEEAAEAAQATQEQEASETEASQPDTEQPGGTPDPVAPGEDVVQENPNRTVEEGLAIGNPYVGQPEPAGGCPNSNAIDPVWDPDIGGWRAHNPDGRAILIDPWGGIRRL